MKRIYILLFVLLQFLSVNPAIGDEPDSAAFLESMQKINEMKKANQKIDKVTAQDLVNPISKEAMSEGQRAYEFGAIMEAAEVDHHIRVAVFMWFQNQVRAYGRLRYTQENPDLVKEIKTAIIIGTLNIGMTPAQAAASWGKPDDINRTVTKHGTIEQWVYRGREAFVYFENGKLTGWQD